ncbi:MAG: hypothetical protein MSIBF_03025 [Candidatus Altiarchaeales archaeon IMC4]|nr:MAG: hypothetical protein MSIBF_03025 [Candidatus Altiarchaeales archaeon IMC4]
MHVLKERGRTLHVWRNINLSISRILIFVSLFILGVLLFVEGWFGYESVGLILIPVSYVLGIAAYRKYVIWGIGEIGEKSVTEALDPLGDEYLLINGAVMPSNRGDTDHILIGPNGIFVFETKHYSGEVSCDGDHWSRRKIGRAGAPYGIKIGKPGNQVKRNANVLKDFILAHKEEIFKRQAPHIWVHGAVVFTNPLVTLNIKNPTVDVLKTEEVCGFVKGQKGAKFSNDEVEEMANVILKYAG